MKQSSIDFTGMVIGGLLPPDANQRFLAALRGMEGKRARVSLSEVKRRRSLNQNAYYWGVVVASITQMFRDAGNYIDAEGVHEFLKLRVAKLSQVLVTPDGEVIKTLGSTTRLSTQEFELYLERVRAWAAEMGCPIPLPNESTINEGN